MGGGRVGMSTVTAGVQNKVGGVMMKVKINGFDVEGTPEEISAVLKLVDRKEIEYIPIYPHYPPAPPWTVPTYPSYPVWTVCSDANTKTI